MTVFFHALVDVVQEVSLRVEKRISNEVPPLKVSAQDVEDLLTE